MKFYEAVTLHTYVRELFPCDLKPLTKISMQQIWLAMREDHSMVGFLRAVLVVEGSSFEL